MSIDKFRLHDILQTLVVISNASEALKHRLYESLEKLCEGSEQVCPIKIPEKEMTAKELVRRVGGIAHEMKGSIDEEDYNQGMKAMYAIFKKEAGL